VVGNDVPRMVLPLNPRALDLLPGGVGPAGAEPGPRVLIVGAGVAGLALALALRQRGVSPTLIERAPALRTEGAGLYLVGAATRALRNLGLEAAVRERASVIVTQSLFDRGGAMLARTDVEAFWGACGQCLGVSRAALHSLLAEQVGSRSVRFGVGLRALQQEPERVLAECSDGSRAVYDLVVGADGIHSTVRSLVFNDAAVRFRRQMSWRFVAPLPAKISGWTVFMGPGRAFLYVPIAERTAYCYADLVVDRPCEDPAAARPDRLRQVFRGFARPVQDTLAALEDDHPIHYAPIEEVATPQLGQGRVVLIGDAAHAMSPNMACGAGMGLEDATVLAELVATHGVGGALVPELMRRRLGRIEWIRAQSERRDRMRALPSWLRNASLRMLWNRIYAANYRPLLTPP